MVQDLQGEAIINELLDAGKSMLTAHSSSLLHTASLQKAIM